MKYLRLLLTTLTHARCRAFFAGLVAGGLIIASIAPVRMTFGLGTFTDGAILASLCMAGLASQVRRSGRLVPKWLSALVLPLAAGWSLVVPWLLQWMRPLAEMFSLSAWENSLFASGMVSAACVLCLTPVFVAAASSYSRFDEIGRASGRFWMAGTCLAFLVVPVAIAPLIGIGWLSLAALAASLVVIALGRFDHRPPFIPLAAQNTSHATKQVSLADLAQAVLCGAGLATMVCLASHWMLRSLACDFFLCIGVLLGSQLFVPTPGADRTGQAWYRMTTALIFATWLASLVALDPLWANWCLTMNAWVSSLTNLYLLRAGLLLLIALPWGLVCGRLVACNSTTQARGHVPTRLLFALTGGYVSACAVDFSPKMISICILAAALILAAAVWLISIRKLPMGFRRRLVTGGLLATTLLALDSSGNPRPDRTERRLFSSQAIQAYRGGTQISQLDGVDEGRLVTSFESLGDRTSLWKYRGSQLLIRRNGLQAEIHVSDPNLAPRNPTDIVGVILPLTLHSSPENVLVLGAHVPTLQVCQAWPLHSVTTLDPARSSRHLTDWLLSHASYGLNLSGGPDFHFRKVGIELGLAAKHALRYDVIASPLMQPISAAALGQTTCEFYRMVAGHLAEGGLFSQRIPYYDLGPAAVRKMTATMQSVFPHVQVVESTPGELIFLCSRTDFPAVGPEFLERLQARQCRTLLGQAGWDWTVVLGRGALKPEGLKEFVGHQNTIHSVTDARLAFELPVEISRWGQKAEATRAALAKQGAALRSWLGDIPEDKIVSQRLEDLNLAHKLQGEHPDDPWAYRAALKDRLKERPRATITQVKHELKRVRDPEDQRRLDYLVALGKSATKSRPSPQQIQELAEYEFPFDPLLSIFVHYEAAHLLERSSPKADDEQLRHLLHTVYYASPLDQSIRNVCQAIDKICSEPNLIALTSDRWDHVNGLLQILGSRWQSRINSQKFSKFESSDLEISLASTERAIDFLSSNREAVGLSTAEWKQRQEILEDSLHGLLLRRRSQTVGRLTSAPRVQASGPETK